MYRQDIDLGVQREVYDVNLRRELEREQEQVLQKEREKVSNFHHYSLTISQVFQYKGNILNAFKKKKIIQHFQFFFI